MEYFFSDIGEGLGLWKLFVGADYPSTLIFVSWPVGTEILGILAGGSLGMLALFPPWIFLEGGGCIMFKQSSPCEG